jgi:DNA-binding transcriptional ArsR family regulator
MYLFFEEAKKQRRSRVDTFILLGEYDSMQLDDTLIALADDTRRRILRRLASGEARVTEVAEPFDISLNSVSKHIRLLERAGLVRRRVSGRDHFLALEPKPFDELTQWMQDTRQFWSSRLDRLEAALHADDTIEKARKTSPSPKKRSSK